MKHTNIPVPVLLALGLALGLAVWVTFPARANDEPTYWSDTVDASECAAASGDAMIDCDAARGAKRGNVLFPSSVQDGFVVGPLGSVLIIVEYEGGRMKTVKSFSGGAWCNSIEGIMKRMEELTGKECTLPDTYKLMLVDGTTLAPLCPAWEKE